MSTHAGFIICLEDIFLINPIVKDVNAILLVSTFIKVNMSSIVEKMYIYCYRTLNIVLEITQKLPLSTDLIRHA